VGRVNLSHTLLVIAVITKPETQAPPFDAVWPEAS